MTETTTDVRVHIRWMIRRDMPEVLAIEDASFPRPWSEGEFLAILRRRNCIGMVAEAGERIAGFMIYELHRDRLEILNFAANPADRRRGVGRQLLAKLVGKLSSQRRTRLVLNCRETSVDFQCFLRRQGFLATGVVRDAYEDTGEDAYAMEYAIHDAERGEAC